ncbi:MAG: tail fiber protein [Flavobacteriales bacterium]|jgi:hypothetical protein|nr:tail fiber protein [Flavobacteriales bacterium]
MKNLLLIAMVLLTVSMTAQRNRYKNITELNGKIGIGTTQPDELLTVKGKIHTQEVLVDLNGAVAPDYVFESYFTGTSTSNPLYTMPTLAELASYIEEHHHLPGVPSAATLEEEGISLKEMNLVLLQKIEELTLYTLEQQREIEQLKKAVSSIEPKE